MVKLATFVYFSCLCSVNYFKMNKLQIEILNPKAAKLLQDLADLDLISIKQPIENGFAKILEKLRSNANTVPTSEEITQEVELVRQIKYGKDQ